MSVSQETKRARWTPSIRVQRTLAFILLLCQGGITVTGSIVRVTGSGLGCDTWPACHAGSLVPVAGAAPMVQQFVEFGNRLLTFVVGAAALAVCIAMYAAKRRTELKVYAWISGLGVIAQAVIGGITVLVDLHWWAVAVHFLPSMILVWNAALLYMRIREPDDVEPTHLFPQAVRVLVALAAVALATVLITGTMVTGSGPHSGDAGIDMEDRLQLDTTMLVYVHSACMYVYLAFTIIAAILLFTRKAPKAARTTVSILILMIIVQWAIGITQFYLGVPRWTIPAHIAMSSVVVAFSAFLWAHGYRRVGESAAQLTGSVAGDEKKLATIA